MPDSYQIDSRGVVEVIDPETYRATHPDADIATCGVCDRSWDDSVATACTPTPSGRCPFEYDHDEYEAQSARDARERGYGDRTYWEYLERSAKEKRDYFLWHGDPERAAEMMTRSLSEVLRGNNGD
jgi:hypothetical protein